MKNLICILGVLIVLFTACTNKKDNIKEQDGTVVEDNVNVDEEGDGLIDDAADKAAEGTKDITEGAKDTVDDAVGGVENALDDVTSSNE